MDRILLVVPPFQAVSTPGLGVSLLKAGLERKSIPTEVLYLNFDFAQRIGLFLYDRVSKLAHTLLGDFVFSFALYDRPAEERREAIARFVDELIDDELRFALIGASSISDVHELLGHLAEAASGWIDDAATRILERDPWMVGFTSTFQQNASSLSIMRRVKERRPELLTAMGGGNCAGEMGTALFELFPQIDYLAHGESDHCFVELAETLQRGAIARDIAGILSRQDEAPPAPARFLNGKELDELAPPDFDDYFAQMNPERFDARIETALVVETSRGCWWGAKNHCTFCGLNAEGMAFRSKSSERAKSEMRGLVDRYGIPRIAAVDNILDMKYFKSVLPELAEEPVAELFYEIKANLTRDQVKTMADAHVRWVQPGIESLSDRTLSLMRKGVTELQNVQLLKWCAEFGILVSWNHLFGFPGEDESEVEQIAHDAETLQHLEPPMSSAVLHMDRFSPYFDQAEEYGLAPIRAARPYAHVYPYPDDVMQRLAYFFDTDHFLEKEDSPAFTVLHDAMVRWRELAPRAHLIAVPRRDALLLLDTRTCTTRRLHRLTGNARRVYEAASEIASRKAIAKAVGPDVEASEVDALLAQLEADRLLLVRNERALALATEALPSYKRYATVAPMGRVLPWTLGRAVGTLLRAGRLRRAAGTLKRRVAFGAREEAQAMRLRVLRSAATALAQQR